MVHWYIGIDEYLHGQRVQNVENYIIFLLKTYRMYLETLWQCQSQPTGLQSVPIKAGALIEQFFPERLNFISKNRVFLLDLDK